jgi:hypothetical protein
MKKYYKSDPNASNIKFLLLENNFLKKLKSNCWQKKFLLINNLKICQARCYHQLFFFLNRAAKNILR